MLIRGHGNVGEKILEFDPSDIFVSTITEVKLWFGVEKKGSAELKKLVETFFKAN